MVKKKVTAADREELIRQRAHALWVQEGHPHGREHIHWEMASALVDGEAAAPKPKAARKPAVKTKPKLRAVR